MAEKNLESKFETHLKDVTFKVLRYSGEGDSTKFEEYKVPVIGGMTVLEGLIYIKENLDNTLSWRASCRMGICGSCGMFINNFPMLACQTQIMDLNSDVIEIKPMPNYPIIKDLVPDLTKLIEKHKSIKPYILRKDSAPEEIDGEFYQSVEELERYEQFTFCIKCGICLAACPTVATAEEFTGPQALAQAYRYSVDTRDQGFDERKEVVDNPLGVFRCHFAGSCSEACPKGVDPALAIQLLKKTIVKDSLFGKKLVHDTKILPIKQENPKKRDNIPPAPPKSVE